MDHPQDPQARVAALEARALALEAELTRLRHLLAHDLKAPMRHITGYAQVIEEDFGPDSAAVLDSQLAAHLKTIVQAVAELRNLIDRGVT